MPGGRPLSHRADLQEGARVAEYSCVQQYSFKICTDSYTVKDVVRLMNVLIIRYELDCTLRFHTPTQPRIHIKQRSMPKLRAIVRPYFCESMMYKLGDM